MVTHCPEQDTTGAGTIQAQDENKLCSLKSYNTNGQGTEKVDSLLGIFLKLQDTTICQGRQRQ